MSQSRSESRAQSRAAASKKSNRQLIITLAACLVVAIIVLVVGILVTKSVSYTNAETHILAGIAASRVPFLVSVSLGLDWLFSPPIAVVIGVVSAGIIFLVTRRWMTVLHFALLVLGSWLSSEVIKVIVHRPRPKGVADVLVPNPDPDSYPSGHVCFAVGLALAVFLLVYSTRVRALVAVLGILLIAIVCFSRIYLAIHFPTDVAASVVFAVAAFVAIEALWRRFAQPRAVEAEPAS